jgi:ubiquinone biosynthesis protein COQ4
MLRFEELGRSIRNLGLVTDFLKSMGTKTETIFDIDDNFLESPQMEACVQRVKAIPAAESMMASRYLGPEIDLEVLANLPPGTLGHNFARVIQALGYDPNFYRRREIKTDGEWVMMRARKFHDIVHTISGFGPTGGELGVLSIQAVQIGYPTSVLLEVVSLGAAFKLHPEKLAQVMHQMARGMAMGLQAQPFIAQDWDTGWDKPLALWRQELNITDPVIDEPYSMKNRLPDLDLAVW